MNKKSISKITSAGILASVALSSCTTLNPYTGAQEASKTLKGAGIGAAGGAILGAIIGNNTGDGDSKKGALIGAAIGGAAGGGIGNYMDRQEAKIRQQLQGSGVSVTRAGKDIILNMPHDITFATGQDFLRNDFTNTLDSVALVLKEYDKTSISVEGHTDSDGSDSYNQGLSERRAYTVANYLERRGVASQRVLSQGFGERSPISSNTSAAGKAQNRRVELRIVPQQSQFQ